MSGSGKVKDETDNSKVYKQANAASIDRNTCTECPPYKGCNSGPTKSKDKYGKQKHKNIDRKKILIKKEDLTKIVKERLELEGDGFPAEFSWMSEEKTVDGGLDHYELDNVWVEVEQ